MGPGLQQSSALCSVPAPPKLPRPPSEDGVPTAASQPLPSVCCYPASSWDGATTCGRLPDEPSCEQIWCVSQNRSQSPVITGISLSFSSLSFAASVVVEPRSSQERLVPERGGEGTHPAKAQTLMAQSIRPSTPSQTGPPCPQAIFRATHVQPDTLLGGTWQQVPAPHQLILLPATSQGLTGINTSTSPLTTCLSIRGANLPALRAAGGGAALSRLTSSPAGHWGPGREGAAGACAEPEAQCLLGTPCRVLGVKAPPSPHPPKPPPGSASPPLTSP